MKEDESHETMGFVSNLFNGQVLAVYDECEQCECLAQGKAGVEQFRSIIVFDLGRHTRCQVQVAKILHECTIWAKAVDLWKINVTDGK